MTSHDPTDRQREILAAIIRLTAERGFPPTLRELGNALGVRSTNAMTETLRRLERHGWIKRDRLVSRGIRVVDPQAPKIPLDVLLAPDEATAAALRLQRPSAIVVAPDTNFPTRWTFAPPKDGSYTLTMTDGMQHIVTVRGTSTRPW